VVVLKHMQYLKSLAHLNIEHISYVSAIVGAEVAPYVLLVDALESVLVIYDELILVGVLVLVSMPLVTSGVLLMLLSDVVARSSGVLVGMPMVLVIVGEIILVDVLVLVGMLSVTGCVLLVASSGMLLEASGDPVGVLILSGVLVITVLVSA
jgi:hypothetical protein